MNQQIEADKRRAIARLRSERKEATTQEEREQIDAEIETRKAMRMPDISKFYSAFTTPKVTTFYVAAGVVGCLINLLFLISGIGLFYCPLSPSGTLQFVKSLPLNNAINPSGGVLSPATAHLPSVRLATPTAVV